MLCQHCTYNFVPNSDRRCPKCGYFNTINMVEKPTIQEMPTVTFDSISPVVIKEIETEVIKDVVQEKVEDISSSEIKLF
jgi:predicted ATP-dependent serine protease